jgi:LysR family transcriptional activator of glutamate synthase operon
MEIRQLECVVAVAKFKNFTQAARAIHLSQSSLSQQIKKLEKELGIKIFERNTRNIKITPVGAEFINHALRVLSEINQVHSTIKEYLTTNRGQIKIGMMPVVSYYQLTQQISQFQKSYPGIKLHFTEAECEKLHDMVLKSEVDVAMLSEIEPEPRLQMIRLINDRLYLVTNSLHPLATKESVSLTDLAYEKLIIPNSDSGLYRNLIDACHKVNFVPRIYYQCSQVETILDFVRNGLGITLLSKTVASRFSNQDLVIIPVVPAIPRRISLAFKNIEELSPVLNVFIRFFQNRRRSGDHNLQRKVI